MAAGWSSGLPEMRGSFRTPAFEHANVSDAMRPLLVVTSTGMPLGVVSSLDVAGVVAWGDA